MTAVLAGATLFGASTAVQAADIIIDDFNTGGSLTLPGDGSGGTTATDTASAPTTEIIGGEREASLEIVNAGNSSSVVQATVSSGTLDIGAGPQGTGAEYKAIFTYDGSGSPGSGLGVDLTDGGTNDRFIAIIDENDFPISFELTLNDGTNTDTFAGSTPGGIAPAAPQATASVLFADFPNFGGPGAVDFTSIESIELAFTFGSGADLSFDVIASSSPVPVPATFGLVGAGLIGLGLVARRRARI